MKQITKTYKVNKTTLSEIGSLGGIFPLFPPTPYYICI